MQLIVNAPVNALNWIGDQNMYLLLSHLMDIPQYFEFFRSRSDRYLIFDNSAFELGAPNYDSLERAVEELKVNEVVAPDVPFDGKQTYVQTREFVKQYKKSIPQVKIVGVIQGKDVKEVKECIRKLLDLEIDVIAIPKWCGTKFAHVPAYGATLSRYRVFCELKEQMLKYERMLPVHLLGLNSPEVELPAYRQLARSIDTSFPFRSLVPQFSYETDFPEELKGEVKSRIEYLKDFLANPREEFRKL